MKRNYTFLILFSVIYVGQCAFVDIFPRCRSTDEECLKKAIKVSMALIKNGLPSLGIPAIDPLDISDITLPYNSSFGWMSLRLKDAALHGMQNLELLSVQNDFATGGLNMAAQVFIPQIILSSDEYRMSGYIMEMPLSGSGPCKVIFHNVTVDIKLDNMEQVKDEEKYIHVENFDVTIEPEKITFDLPNLKAGDKYLGDALTLIMNNLHQQIYAEIRQVIQTQLGEILKNISNSFFHVFPHQSLFII